MKVRVISAIIVLLVCIPIIIVGGNLFYIAASIVGLIGFLEMLNVKCKKDDIPYPMKVIGVVSFLLIMISNWDLMYSTYTLDYGRITTVILLVLIPLIFYNKSKKYTTEDAMFLLGMVFFLGISFNQLVNIRISSLSYFLFLILITIITDSFAFIIGKFVGKHKMCPTVSPNKTWEGFVGGLVFATAICSILYASIFDFTGNILLLVLVIMILSVLAQMGDLVFSSIKRYFGIKDYSNLIPGHGGILDRLDSILFVMLAFSYIKMFL